MTLAKRTPAPVGLMRVEEARAMLAQCVRVDEAKSIKDKAGAIQAYLRQQGASRDAQNDAAEIKLRAEHRLVVEYTLDVAIPNQQNHALKWVRPAESYPPIPF